MDTRERNYVTSSRGDVWKHGYTNLGKTMLLDQSGNLDNTLIVVAEHGHMKLVKLLLNVGANVRAQDDQALIWASANGRTDTVKVLLAAGADVHAQDGEALKVAKQNGYTEIIQLLQHATI